MKKTFLLGIFAAGASLSSLAQKSAVRTANNHLSYQEYDQALKAIEGAINDPSTKDDPKTWYVRGNIYYAMQQAGLQASQKPYKEAARSYVRAAELGSKEEDLGARLHGTAYYYLVDAQGLYNAKDYKSAYASFDTIGYIYASNVGSRFAAIKQKDTFAAEAMMLKAYSALYAKDYVNAIAAFEQAKSSPIVRDANMYQNLAEAYKQNGDDSKFLATLEEGKSLYPDNQSLRNEELNYYIRNGKQAELTAKLEEAVSKDPANSELYFNLGNAYMNMAFPKSAAASSQRPSNYDSSVAKAERAFASAVRLAQNNPDYSYNMGALYFNQAAEINKQINNISGNTTADQRKVDALRIQRDNFFAKATPYLERSYALIDIKGSSMSEQEKDIYLQSLFALREVYLRTNQTAKADEAKRKYDAASSGK